MAAGGLDCGRPGAGQTDDSSVGGASGIGDLLQGRLAASTSRSNLSKSRPSMRNLFGPRISSGSYVYLQPHRTDIQSSHITGQRERFRGNKPLQSKPIGIVGGNPTDAHTIAAADDTPLMLGLQDNHLGGRQTRFTRVSHTISEPRNLELKLSVLDCYLRSPQIENRHCPSVPGADLKTIPDVFPERRNGVS
jgi:hypothetical protein